MPATTVHRTCHLCEAACGLAFTVEGGRIAAVRNDPDDPFSRGFCCPKGLALDRFQDDPDRLRAPLVRGPDGELREAGWGEALARASEGLARVLRRRGPDALAVYLGNPIVHSLGAVVGTEVFRTLLPTRNRYTANSVDANPQLLANYLMFGMHLAQPVPDLDRTRYLLVLGANPLVSNGSLMTAPGVGRRLKAIEARGGRVVVVDPRRTETARVASEHLFIRPGRDPLLLLALVRELAATDRWDRAFLERWGRGWEDLPRLLTAFTPERVAPRLGPDWEAATVRRLADELAAPGAAVYVRVGVCNAEFAGLTGWAANLLNAVTGNLDREGGVLFPESPASWLLRHPHARGSYARYRSPQGAPEVLGEYPVRLLADQIERGRRDPDAPEAVHALVTFAGNPVLSTPAGHRLAEAIERLEFRVAVDVYPSETARLADVVLPPRSPLHEPHFDVIFQQLAVADLARWDPPVLPPPAGAPSEFELITRLAAATVDRLRPRGLDGLRRRVLARIAPQVTPERLGAFALRWGPRGRGARPFGRGLTPAGLRGLARGAPPEPLAAGRLGRRIVHRSGRIECAPAPYREDLPRLAATLDAPGDDAAGADGALLLIGRRQLRTNNSWLHNLEPLVGPKNRCTLQVHPDDAADRGLAAGDRARVTSRAGAVVVEVETTADLAPGVVSLPHGWGHARHGGRVARAHAGVSANDLTDPGRYDPLTGNPVLNGVPVTVEPAGASDP